MLVLLDELPKGEQLACRLRREPAPDVGGLRETALQGQGGNPRVDVAQLVLEHELVVRLRLDVHEQAVERSDVDAGRIEAALERLYERRSRARERIEDVLSPPEVPCEQDLYELRYELAEIRVQPVDVLRPLPLRQVALRPGELEIDVLIECFLRRSHEESSSTRSSCRLLSTRDG